MLIKTDWRGSFVKRKENYRQLSSKLCIFDQSILSYEGGDECQHRPVSGADTDVFTLALHCPGLTSLRWVVRLYSLVLGGLGVILSFAWVSFHLYVLSMTSLVELRQHRSALVCVMEY